MKIIITMKITILAILVIGTISRTYPLYRQCDPQWSNEQLGTSSNTICSDGCLMSSAAMALTGIGHNFNPSTLNQWLKQHGGYVSGDLFVWHSINTLGLLFEGKVKNAEIKSKLDQGKVVMCNVHNGGHWVLAYAYNGDNILVNDPYYSTTSYNLNEIVNGQNGIYQVYKLGNEKQRNSQSMMEVGKVEADGRKIKSQILTS